jgi:hypothetical protein
MAMITDDPINVYGATLSRRQFVKTGGALLVGIGLVGRRVWETTAEAATTKNSIDAALTSSWFEIHPDNTIRAPGKWTSGRALLTLPTSRSLRKN